MATLESIAAQNKQILGNQKEMKEAVGALTRGMYGDPINRKKGLIERQDLDEKRLKKIESKQYKQAIILAALLGLFTFLMNGGLDILNNIFGK